MRKEGTIRAKIHQSKGALIALSSLTACRREMNNAACNKAVHCLGDDAVLQHELDEIQDVIDNDFCAGRSKVEDIRRQKRHAR